jgi:RNA polymerase-interacting CarD/CdnL/TRCF family regulator
MRPVISQEEAEALIAAIPDIEPAVCNDTRFNHVDAFYKELFRKHTPEALVSIIKGLRIRAMGKKAKSSRAEATMKRAKEALYGELSVALSIAYPETEEYVKKQVGEV